MSSPASQEPPPKVALITGAAQGIGAAIAIRLAQDGYDIALVDLLSQKAQLETVSTQVQGEGRKAAVIFADVAFEEDVKQAVEKCVDALGGLGVMVANAGIAVFGTILEASVEDWDRIQTVNARGVFLSYKYAALQMIKQGKGGRIIGACSSAGKKGTPHLGAYSASKFAVRGLTQVAAQEFALHNITVNCYAPAFISTAMISRPEDEKLGGHGAWVKSLYGVPIGHEFPSPDNVTELVSYLVKPAAQRVTGECINLNGVFHFD